VARIEVEPDAIARAVELHAVLDARLREAGYTYVSLDLVGYRSGAMNEVLARSSDVPEAPA
jgi:uncharacterized protein